MPGCFAGTWAHIAAQPMRTGQSAGQPPERGAEPIDLGAMLRSEMTIIASQGYPTEIFEVTGNIAEHAPRFSRLVSHRVPFSDAERAFELALTPGAAEKVVVSFDD